MFSQRQELPLLTSILLVTQVLFLAISALVVLKQGGGTEARITYKSGRAMRRSVSTLDHWPAVEPLEEVVLWFQQTKHYQFSKLGELESDFLLPPSGHLINMKTPEGSQNYTVGMFHQLRCIQIMRSDITHLRKSEHVDHCLKYLWQSALCSANTQLEGIFIPRNLTTVAPIPRDYRCRNWQALYDAAARQMR